jgi:16S rRNA (cytosine1402-N4)-methyltransferase
VPQSSDPIADSTADLTANLTADLTANSTADLTANSTAEHTPEFIPIEHISVLPEAAIAGLVDTVTHPGGHYLDCTAGAGGHTRRILEADPEAQVTAIDRDAQALETARRKLVDFGDRVHFWHGNFADFPYVKHTGEFAGIFADLGVSSGQLDLVDRGFSFRNDAPLDMRMDRSQSFCAADIVNHWNETDLANAIYEYGEERLSRRIAREIVAKRPFESTTQLAEVISRSVPKSYRYGRIHPATRTFQALRIVVNAELDSLETWLDTAPIALKPSGRIGAISFHSLEDRIVKHRFRESEQLKVLTKKPIIASDTEAEANPRARSAKLRFAQRLPITN